MTHSMKVVFKARKKLIKYFLSIFFLYTEMTNKYYGKDKKRLRKEALKNYKNKYEEENDKAEKGPRKISKFY